MKKIILIIFILCAPVYADEMTFYPDANPESTSVDGFADVLSMMIGESWSTLVSASGIEQYDISSLVERNLFAASSFANKWALLTRFIFLFDTSSLPDEATITSAVISIYGTYKNDPTSLTPDLNIYGASTSSNTSISTSDFEGCGSIAFCDTPISYADFNTSGYNSFTLNSSGISAISKTGISKFSMRNANYDVANSAPSWSDLAAPIFKFYMADRTGTSEDPKLVITYTDGTAVESSVTISMSGGINLSGGLKIE